MSAASLTLGGIHAHIWLRRRKSADSRANLAFAVLAIAVAVMGFMELRMMRAATPEEFQRVLLWYHLPILAAMSATVAFTHYYLNVGRLWLGMTSIGLRAVALMLGVLTGGTMNYQRIDALGVVELLGDPVVVVTEAVASPWLLLSQPALALLVLFLADATRQLWQRGDRTRALSIGAGLLLFAVVNSAMALASYWGFLRLPTIAIAFFMPFVLVMATYLGTDLLRSAELRLELGGVRAPPVAGGRRCGCGLVEPRCLERSVLGDAACLCDLRPAARTRHRYRRPPCSHPSAGPATRGAGAASRAHRGRRQQS